MTPARRKTSSANARFRGAHRAANELLCRLMAKYTPHPASWKIRLRRRSSALASRDHVVGTATQSAREERPATWKQCVKRSRRPVRARRKSRERRRCGQASRSRIRGAISPQSAAEIRRINRKTWLGPGRTRTFIHFPADTRRGVVRGTRRSAFDGCDHHAAHDFATSAGGGPAPVIALRPRRDGVPIETLCVSRT